uniref:Putative vacuolar sorting protein 9 n=2 Tax=Ixodes TaxID=6944 RepID=V5IBX3_IXORI
MLRTVPRLSPSQKIRVLVYVVRLICMDPASPEGIQDKPLGADDLVPTLSYVLVQSAVPQLYSECLALEQVLDSRYMLGEEGYCLTSILMALKYLESLS